MVDILGTDIATPSISFFNGSWIWITIFAIIVVFTLIIAVVIWVLVMKKKYNIKIRIFENVAGQGYQHVGNDSARLIRIGDTGEEVLYLRKKKFYRTAYGRKMGQNTYWFAIGQDGYWYNIVLGDLDAKKGMLDIEPVDRDMRYAYVSIGKNARDRYTKRKIERTLMIAGGIMILALIIFLVGEWFLIAKIGEVAREVTAAQANAQPMYEAMKTIVAHLDSICGGSGITPAA